MTKLEFLKVFQDETTKGNNKLLSQSGAILKTKLREITQEDKESCINLATKLKIDNSDEKLDSLISICLFLKVEYDTYKEFNSEEMTFAKYISIIFQ